MDTRLSQIASRHPGLTIKRLVDVFGAAAGLVLFIPLGLLVSVLIWLESGGPVFYRQERIGKGGQRFWMLKFRSMPVGAERLLEAYLETRVDCRQEFESYQKLFPDPRPTTIGRLLRRFSLDELPQLWNVLKGEMSLVGPRPCLPEQLANYDQLYQSYADFRPGMTGLWQVSGRNRLTFVERVRLDERYLQNWSLGLDWQILCATPTAVLFQEGVTKNEEVLNTDKE
jgi:exopolysaccharide production protein ExoY